MGPHRFHNPLRNLRNHRSLTKIEFQSFILHNLA
jgi:hypothetical protein